VSGFTRLAGTMALGIIMALPGCGYVTPAIQENRADPVAGQQLVDSIVYNIKCELQDAVHNLYNNPDYRRDHTFLDSWGAQTTLNLQVEEKSTLSPNANWIPPNPVTALFNLFFGGSLLGVATRQDKLNSYNTIQQIKALPPCGSARPGGILLMQSDLGLAEWLQDNVTEADTGRIQYALDYSDGPLKTNVISHEIKFEVTTTANLTPGWKLRTWQVNQSGTLLSATRDRINDLTITLGPTVPTPRTTINAQGQTVTTIGYVPSPQASEAALASQIGLAVSNALKGTLQP
jgi:hypothetical protein